MFVSTASTHAHLLLRFNSLHPIIVACYFSVVEQCVLSLSRYLDIDPVAWSGLEETAGSSSASRHVGPVRHSTLSLPYRWILESKM